VRRQYRNANFVSGEPLEVTEKDFVIEQNSDVSGRLQGNQIESFQV